MSAPRVQVRKMVGSGLWIWSCTGEIADYHHGPYIHPGWAADAGRAHLAERHPSTGSTYCREHGTHVSDCRSTHEARHDH